MLDVQYANDNVYRASKGTYTKLDAKEIAQSNTVYAALSGSWAYGLNIETSDRDERGVFIPPAKHLLGLSSFHVDSWGDKATDTQYCSLGSFLSYCETGAPNWVEILFVDDAHVLSSSDFIRPILRHRDIFLTKTLGRKSVGFINGMHRRAMDGLAKLRKGDGDVVLLHNAPGWDEPQIRKGLMHGIRVGRMLCEVMETGAALRVNRSFERDDLLAVRLGPRSIESAADECLELSDRLKELSEFSSLPNCCDSATLNDLAVNVTMAYWSKQ